MSFSEHSLGHIAEVSSRLMNNRLNQRFNDNDIPVTAEQWAILNILLEEDGLSQNKLARLAVKDHTSISRLIDHLIKKQLVKRNTDPTDRRTKLIYVTEKGKELQLGVTRQIQDQIAAELEGIDQASLQICSDVLTRIIQNLK